MRSWHRAAPNLLAVAFGVSSVLHVLRPRVFDALIPRWLPCPRGINYLSGAAEALCAAGLVTKARWARGASVALLIAVFPGNVQMAVNAVEEAEGRFTPSTFLAFARLPMQLPLIWAAWQAKAVPKRPQE